jgi:ribA/ribD-fused uncharacterized protein
MIKFGGKSSEHPELSNFHRAVFVLDGDFWSTVEHYYQAQKFTPHDMGWAVQIREASGPGMAKKMGRSEEHQMRDDWEDVKEDVMRRSLREKFSQNPRCRDALLGTGDEQLVEHAPWGDFYWGDGGDGTGQNRLGELLMELRSEMREESDG